MKLGISMAFPHTSPEEWAKKHRAAGLEAVVFPCDYQTPVATIDRYAAAARDAGLYIAEVGAWSNPLSPVAATRQESINRCCHQLELAEYIQAGCCVNITGAAGDIWDGGYAENYSAATYDLLVKTVREIIDSVNPIHTRYALEPMPYMLPDSPESYLRLIKDIDRRGLAVHIDAVNMLSSPERYFNNRSFVTHCFDLLGDRVRSCHLKDSRLENSLTLTIREVECGEGGFDIAHYCREADRINPNLPMIIEHLPGLEAYERAIRYVRDITGSK